jgi:hypothetical protein
MTPASLYRPISLVLVVAICAVILSARLLSHTHVETAPPPADIESEHHDELPPVW